MKRSYIAAIGTLLIITGVVAQRPWRRGDRSLSNASDGRPLLSVSLSAFEGTFVNLPIYVAESLGLFDKHGLSVDIVYGTGIQVANAVVSGSVDFGGFAIEHALQLVDKGQALRILVLNQAATPFTLIVRNGVPLPDSDLGFPAVMRHLIGLQLAVSSRGAGSDIMLRFLLTQGGIDPDRDVTIAPLGEPGAQIAALTQGLVDGAMAFEPIQTQAVHILRCCKPVIDLQGGEGPAILADYPYNGIVVHDSFLGSNHEASKRMVAAIVEATTFIRDETNLDATTAIAARSMPGIERDALKRYLINYRHVYRPHMSKEAFGHVNEVLLRSGLIKRAVAYDAVTAMDLMPTRLTE